MALYVYGIMRASDASAAVSALRKDTARGPKALDHGGVSALISSLPVGELQLRREHILAHADVLQAAFEHGPVLPMRLGTAMPDESAVTQELLAPDAGNLASRLDALDGRAEMRVKAQYTEQPLLRSVLDRDPTLRHAVERTRQLPAAATHFEQIRIGEAVAAAVQARRVADGDTLLGVLRQFALAVSPSPPHHERAVMNTGFLVDRDQLHEFDSAVERLSEERAGEIEFKLIGPLPPYSFAGGEWAQTSQPRSGAGWA